MRLNSTFESLESGELPNTSAKSAYSEMRESPESPDEQTEDKEEGFIDESHKVPSPQSITSCMITEYLEQVHKEEAIVSLFDQALPRI